MLYSFGDDGNILSWDLASLTLVSTHCVTMYVPMHACVQVHTDFLRCAVQWSDSIMSAMQRHFLSTNANTSAGEKRPRWRVHCSNYV